MNPKLDNYISSLIDSFTACASVKVLHTKKYDATLLIFYGSNNDVSEMRCTLRSIYIEDIKPKLCSTNLKKILQK